MMQQTRKLFLLLALSGILVGFTVEQIGLFYEKAAIVLNDCDPDKEDSAKTKKWSEKDTLRPESLAVNGPFDLSDANPGKKYPARTSLFRTIACRTILTPPPERA